MKRQVANVIKNQVKERRKSIYTYEDKGQAHAQYGSISML